MNETTSWSVSQTESHYSVSHSVKSVSQCFNHSAIRSGCQSAWQNVNHVLRQTSFAMYKSPLPACLVNPGWLSVRNFLCACSDTADPSPLLNKCSLFVSPWLKSVFSRSVMLWYLIINERNHFINKRRILLYQSCIDFISVRPALQNYIMAASHKVQMVKISESTRLPPMWPGFDSPIRRLMWAEFVGSLSCSERFFSGYSGFPLSPKTTISLTRPHKLIALKLLPCINKVSFSFFFTFSEETVVLCRWGSGKRKLGFINGVYNVNSRFTLTKG